MERENRIMNEKLVKASPFIMIGAAIITAGTSILLVQTTKKYTKLLKRSKKATTKK